MENKFHINNFITGASAKQFTPGKFKSIELIDAAGFNKHYQNLSTSQKQFIDLLNNWYEDKKNSFILVTGSPGSGKTFTVIETIKYLAESVLVMAPTARLAKKLNGKTIHSALNLNWTNGSVLDQISKSIEDFELNEDYIQNSLKTSNPISQQELNCTTCPKIVVIDEVSMISFWLLYQIVMYFYKEFYPVLIITMGDERQLLPVKCDFNIFNIQLPDIHPLSLNLLENKRFDAEYQKIIDSIKNLMEDVENVITFIRENYPIVSYMTEHLLKQCSRVLVYKRDTAAKYNKHYLDLMDGPNIILPQVRDGQVNPEYYIRVKVGCNIMVTRNVEVPNGTSLIFLKYDSIRDEIVCKYRDLNETVSIARVMGNFPICVDFAITVHKIQGDTIDGNIVIDFDQTNDIHFMYTALSRVKSKHQILGLLNI